MKAVYYKITDKITGEVLDSGIISDPEQTIYPGQNCYDEEYKLAYECEACKFYQSAGYTKQAEIELIGFTVNEDYILANKTKSIW